MIVQNETPSQNLVQMKVTGLTIDPFTSMPIIILKDMEEKCALPIWIGLIEASAIATELEQIKLSRPMTHDLMRTMLERSEVSVDRIEICDLADNTFYAKIWFIRQGGGFMLDSRPSDAIALALRTKSPIFVTRQVIEKSRKIDLSSEDSTEEQRRQKWTEILENLAPDDFGKYKM
jgi:hypothetical protein